jgi:hypothetical protein
MWRHAPCAEEAAALVLTARALTDVNEAAGFGTCTHQAWERQISTIPARQNLWGASHAHTGVLVILALVPPLTRVWPP